MNYYGLTNIRLERFKAFNKMPKPIRLAPITILMGTNSSGKSSVLQSLLLLKQTLNFSPRTEVLKIDDPLVSFTHLVEATYGWPGWETEKLPETIENGPLLELKWVTGVSLKEVQEGKTRPPDVKKTLEKIEGLQWLASKDDSDVVKIEATLSLEFGWESGFTRLQTLYLKCKIARQESFQEGPELGFIRIGDGVKFQLGLPGEAVKTFSSAKLILEYENFFPYLRAESGATPDARLLYQIFNIFFRIPLEGLRQELTNFSYIGPLRAKPMPFYPYSGSSTQGIDTEGKLAGQLLAQKKEKLVHFVPFVEIISREDGLQQTLLPTKLEEMTLGAAFNYYLQKLGFHESLDAEDNRGTTYRITADHKATIKDIGFGASQILPIIMTGLYADPLFDQKIGEVSIDEYLQRSSASHLMIFEQPEIHLHPRAQSLLAHYLVSMALGGRRILIETHSDHLVRRLRGLIARAYKPEDEIQLRELINIVNFNWKSEGTEHSETQINGNGKFETWPEGFMTEGADEEEQIFLSWVKKEEK